MHSPCLIARVDSHRFAHQQNKDGRYKTITQMKGEPIGDALDYSFVGITAVEDMLSREPVSGCTKAMAAASAVTGAASSSVPRGPTTCVRAPNNSITSIATLPDVLEVLVEDKSKLFWLDLSCNAIADLGDALEAFPGLRVLNLHGNSISTIADLKKICRLPLKSLTIHGNPVEAKKGIKNFLISSIPTLEKLNFCPITKQDRAGAMTWRDIHIESRRRRDD